MNKIDPLASKFAQVIRDKLGNKIEKIILFGSHSRGEATTESDYDFLLLVKNRNRSLRETVLDIEADMLDKHNKLFTSVIYDSKQWNFSKFTPFGKNVAQEGIDI